jgi:hypothetical protein
MNITLTNSQAFALAEKFAGEIHSEVVARNLRLAGFADTHTCLGWTAEVRKALRSIEDRWDRRAFVSDIRYHFQKIREARGTQIRGRDYVAKVRAYEASQAERRAA